MTKRRQFLTFEDALTRMLVKLGEEAAAKAVDRSPWTVRKWADPDHDSLPNVMQAIKLDEAYTRAGHGGAILFQTYTALLKREMESHTIDPKDAALGVQAAVGKLSSEVASATDATSEAGEELSDAEREAILRGAHSAKEQIDRIELAVSKTATPGAQ